MSLIPSTTHDCLPELDEIMRECPPLYLPTSALFSEPWTDDGDLRVWHIPPGDRDYCKDDNPEIVRKMDEHKEDIFNYHLQQATNYNYSIENMLAFGETNYKRHTNKQKQSKQSRDFQAVPPRGQNEY